MADRLTLRGDAYSPGALGKRKRVEEEDGEEADRALCPAVRAQSAEEWTIDAIMFGGGFAVGAKMFRRGTWYGATVMMGGIENYHALTKTSLNFTFNIQRTLSFKTKAMFRQVRNAPRVCHIPANRQTRQSALSVSRNIFVLEAIQSFCRTNPGVAVLVGGPGARDANPFLADYLFKTSEAIPDCGLDCVPASIVHAVRVLRGVDDAKRAEAILRTCEVHFTKLGHAGPVIRRMGLRLSFQRCSREERSILKTDKDSAFRMVAGWDVGCWLIRLVQNKSPRVDHCVMVDSVQKVIWDSAELHPIKLTARSLRMCGGEGCPYLEVAEAWRLL